MWPFQKREQKIPEYNFNKQIAYLHRRISELNRTIEALIAENKIDRDIPNKMKLISGQYRKMLRLVQEFEANMQPVFALVRNLREFVHPGKELISLSEKKDNDRN